MIGQSLEAPHFALPTVKLAEQFLAKLKDTAIQPDEIMVSFDETALFTSLPKKLAEAAIHESLSQLRHDSNTNLKMNLFRYPEALREDLLHIPGPTIRTD